MIRVIHGDCREILPTLDAGSVQCCVTSPPYYGLRAYLPDGHPDKHRELGAEPTPDAYIAELVAVFREVRRVLRDDGCVFLNLGDSYANASPARMLTQSGPAARPCHTQTALPATSIPLGYKPKDLLMMPARVALALQADGWWLRSAITWCKGNPMPESCEDRPTSATEMIYLLTKRPRYFYDALAIAEDAVSDHPSGNGYKRGARLSYADSDGARGNDEQWNGIGGKRNARNWWLINSKPYPAAHFATFPPELAERCIRAGSRPGDVVLDPFGGAGTTGLVADRLGRHATLIELSPSYTSMASARIVDDCPLFAEVAD